MPAVRRVLMETTDNSATSSPAPTSTARRSGRVSKAPQKFAPDAPLATKRKRAAPHDDDDAENDPPEDDPDDLDDGGDDSVDDEPTPRPKKKRPASQSSRPRKPAAKKPKINGDAPGLSNHASKSLPSRPKKTVRIAVARRDAGGLYAEIFASGYSSDKVATDWYHKFQDDDATALTDLVNCILLSAGCDQEVTPDDIRDVDNCANKVADLQALYTEEGITDYPLISRGKSTKSFRDLLVGFFKSLVNIMHETEVLYTNTALMENIARWVASMSSSTLRPFRHTATTVALAMESELVEVSKKLDSRITKLTQQIDAEKSRKGKNKGRLTAIQNNLDEANNNNAICHDQITDFFDTVFVHRYRDVDSKIRTECVEALGSWIWVLPTVFMKPEYLRYLGWMLSDSVPQTRHEVLKQLTRIFQREAEKLGHFIDRFRPRLVEMATQDLDVSVRVAALDVIEVLKTTGNLEPEEVDAIGKMIFDSEIRIRKAVVNFFVDCVNDAIESKVEDMGGNETVDELFGEEDDEDLFAPRRDWISLKCLAEILAAYEYQPEEDEANGPRPLDVAVETLDAAAPPTRVSMAAQVLYERVDHIRNWEILSGYLLYDHSTSSKSRSKQSANEQALRKAVAPVGTEESILLEILAKAVELSFSHPVEADKTKKKSRAEANETTEDTAMALAAAIPRLLRKFGSEPGTAVVVLRLEHFLDLDSLQQLRQDATTYARLLEEICTQFNRHSDRFVISESASALLHARRYDELEEIVDSKMSNLWENVINSLRHFDKLCELSMRGNLDRDALLELGNVLMKMSKIGGITSCTDALEAEGQTDDSSSPAIEILAKMVNRGDLTKVDEELDDPEDEDVAFAIKCCHFYFLWKIRSLVATVQNHGDISSAEGTRLEMLRRTYSDNLMRTLMTRGTNDDLRVFATGALCDLHVLFSTLRNAAESATDGLEKYALLNPLYAEMRKEMIDEFIEVFTAAEAAYAKRARKTLLEPADDEDPIDEDAFSDDEDDAELSAEDKKTRELKAERVMCELSGKLVMAITAKMVDYNGPKAGSLRRRMLRNLNRMGPNIKEVLGYLDEGKQLRDRAAAAKKKAAAAAAAAQQQKAAGKKPAAGGAGKKPLSEEIAVDEDDDGDVNPFEDSEPEEGTLEDLRRRELLDDPIEDGEGDEEEDQGGPSNGRENGERMDEDDSILGD